MNNFDVPQIPVAKEMLKLGAKATGFKLNDKGYIVYLFERSEKTKRLYKQARKNLGLDK